MTTSLGKQPTGHVEGIVISATGNKGLSVTVNGVPARLAVVTEDGTMHVDPAIAREVFCASANAYRDFLRGEGHLRTLRPPIPAQ